MDLLVLGGTAMLGHAVARHALDAGLDVTCLARRSDRAPAGARFVTADRDTDTAYAAVRDHEWDAVIDIAHQPGHARAAVRELRARHWVYVSTASVYARGDRPEQDESGPLVPELTADRMADLEQYGPAKVACENAVREGAARATIVRPGLIGGHGDGSGRSGYYPWRFAHPSGPDVLVPDDPGMPCALIDAQDLAAWLVLAARERIEGTFNATGPTVPLAEVLDLAQAVAGPGAPPARPVPVALLQREGVSAWMGPRSLPLWIDEPDARHFATLDTTAARAHGLVLRPLEQTLASALAFEESRGGPQATGLTDEDETGLRAALDSYVPEADSGR